MATTTDVETPMDPVRSHVVLGMRVDETSYAQASRLIVQWALSRESRCVLTANVHMTMEAYDSPSFRDVVNSADLVTTDGMPLVWMLRALGASGQQRVYGPDLTLHVCRQAEQAGLRVGFVGAKPEALERLVQNIQGLFPRLSIGFRHSPPFRPMTAAEEADLREAIHASRTAILFVGLGCPKQEQWIMAQRGRIAAVMLAVGAAFDFHAGLLKQAPPTLQKLGLEWLFRLCMEPRRLWKRYLKHNPRFAALALLELAGVNRSRPGRGL